LFRSNSFAPKFISEFTNYFGSDYVSSTIRPLIQRLIASDESLEVDPMKAPESTPAELEEHQEALTRYCKEFFDAIVDSVPDIPT
jgi:hypothetical protein